ncbi:MAG: tRNA lysidine(34) synthetase TilS [Holosporales bacterium]|jgi:tRNA(Ile)-lysidine synthase|nr:tRNA lysidine(34) synthetase TilS [Holosporales bacterium]
MIEVERFRDLVAMVDFRNQHVAVAVSGGSDSMALTLLLDEYIRDTSLSAQLTALTVDHRLPEAPDNVTYVSKCMAVRGITHETLVWQHKNIQTRIEEQARIARYELLTKYCIAHNISMLFVAHQALDQIETFVMRLMRGSGITGLCCMRSMSIYNGVTIVRPLLDISPNELKDTLNRFNQSYVTDTGNLLERFERVRIRKTLTQMCDLNIPGAVRSIQNLHQIDQQIESAAISFIDKYVADYCFHKNDFLSLMPMVAHRVLKILLVCKSQNFSPVSYKVLENLYNNITLNSFAGITSHGCWIRCVKTNYIAVEKEPGRRNVRTC